MELKELGDHITRLDAEATEQEALVRALEPYSDPMGVTTVGEIAAGLQPTNPARAQSLLGWAQSLVARRSSIASRATYTLMFKHNEVHQRKQALKRATWMPRAKMVSGTQAFLTGSHSVDEDPGIADFRAEAVAAHLRTSLPPSRTVTVKQHVCSEVCQEAGDRIHLTRCVDVGIYTRAEMLQVGPMRHRAQSMRLAHRGYSDLAAGRPGETEPCPPQRHAQFEARVAELDRQRAPVRALWRELQPYRERFKYDSIGTLVDYLKNDDPDKSRRIVEQLQAAIADPLTPHTLASVTRETLKFVPQTAKLEVGQQAALTDLLSEMSELDGGTSVVFSGWHQTDEETAVADRRGHQLLAYFKPRAHRNVWLTVKPHVCGYHCNRDGIQLLRRIGWVEIQWQPRNVMIEDIRITAVIGPV